MNKEVKILSRVKRKYSTLLYDMMQYLVISQCLLEEQSCSTPVDTRGDNDIHVCRDTIVHHMLHYLHGGTRTYA